MHYYRVKRHGDPGPLGRVRPNRGPGTIGYIAAHKRVYRAKGRAAEHPCATGCGRPADGWSYNHNGGTNEHVQMFRGTPLYYSTSPDDYLPLCRICHQNHDAEHSPNRDPEAALDEWPTDRDVIQTASGALDHGQQDVQTGAPFAASSLDGPRPAVTSERSRLRQPRVPGGRTGRFTVKVSVEDEVRLREMAAARGGISIPKLLVDSTFEAAWGLSDLEAREVIAGLLMIRRELGRVVDLLREGGELGTPLQDQLSRLVRIDDVLDQLSSRIRRRGRRSA